MLASRASRPRLATVALAAAVISGFGVQPLASAYPTPVSAVEPSGPVLTPEETAASAEAVRTGQPVEDESQRTPDRQVFAEPDGSWR